MINGVKVKVTRKIEEADNIVTLELSRENGEALPPFSAGSHIDVETPAGLIRQYSLCNHPAERKRYMISVLRDPNSRGGSASLHDDIQEGDSLTIGEPRNNFPLRAAERFLLFAGGIGVTPLLCMAERLHQRGDVDFELHYSGRAEAKMAFVDRIRSSPFAHRVQFHFDDGEKAQRLDADALLREPAGSLRLFVCGPTAYMDWIIATARAHGWAEDHIHREYFAAGEIDTSGDRPFEVQIASTGAVLQVPANQTVTAVLGQAGVDIPVSCGEGVCGTCVIRVLGGQVDHRDLFLMDDERASNEIFTPCISRALSERLVLDL